MDMHKQFNVKDMLLLTTLTLIVILTSGCGGSEGEESSASTTQPSSARPTPSQDEATVQLERLTLTAFPVKTKGTSELTLITGGEQSFLAVAEYSNGRSTVLNEELSLSDWQSSDTEVAEFIQPGVLQSKASGMVTVSFTKDNLTSNSVGVTVDDATIIDIVVTPSIVSIAKGQNQALTATATYNNGLSMNISDSVIWASDDPSKATITSQNDHGLLKGDDIGSTTITAVKDDITSNNVNVDVSDAVITGISVTPSMVNVAKGQTQALIANIIYSDNTSSKTNDSITWVPAEPDIATVTTSGLLSGVKAGTTTLTAVKDGVTSQPIGVLVSDAVITSISVTPSVVTVAKGQHQTLTANATYSDNTVSDISDSVIWKPVDTHTATVTSDGVLSGSNVGTTTLTAAKDGVTSNTVGVEVSDAVITSISLTPPTVTVAKGYKQTLTATAIYSDNTSSDISDSVTWSPVDASIATVTPEGQVTGVGVGTTAVTAMKDNITSNTIDIDTTDAVMTGLTLNPPAIGLMLNFSQQMKATAEYSDGTSSNVTDSVAWWTSIGTTEISLTNDGLVKGLKTGNSGITATYNGFSHSVEANVCSGNGSNVTGKCIYTLDDGNGNLLTSTPSIAYLNSLDLGGTPHTSGRNGQFYTFTWQQAKAICNKYSEFNLAGRSNWRLLSTVNEFIGFYNTIGLIRVWNNDTYHWTSKKSSSLKYHAYRYTGNNIHVSGPFDVSTPFFATCLSES